MKNVLNWIKSNLVAVIALAVAVIALPVAWYFASGMTASIAEEATQKTSQATRSINSATMTYEIPPIEPGGEPWTTSAPPNEALIAAVVEQRRRVSEAGEAVKAAIIEKNSRGKDVLVESLFPAPAGGESGPRGRVRLTDEMVEAWEALPEQLLERANAGGPQDPEQVLANLRLLRDQRTKEITSARANRNLTEDEQTALREELAARRLEIYRDHAASLSFYANPEGLFGSRDNFNPENRPTRDTYLPTFWGWQHTAWVEQDIVRALRLANEGYAGPLSGPVKRVLAIDVEAWQPNEVSSSGDLTGVISDDLSVSHTGRTGGNAFYDVRYVTVDLIAEAGLLTEIIDALAEVNFITVIDMDIEHIGIEPDIAQGFSYGPNPVARVGLELETLWVRDWYDELMPAPVRELKGLPELETETEDDSADDGMPE
jgi:hypothetical protein